MGRPKKLPSGVFLRADSTALWIRFTDEFGKQIRESTHCPDVAVATALLDRRKREVKARQHPVAGVIMGQISAQKMTYRHFLDDPAIGYYTAIAHLKGVHERKLVIEAFARHAGHLLVRDISLRTLTEYRNRQTCGPRTKNCHRAYILHSMAHAAAHKLYSRDDLVTLRADLKKLPEEQRTRRAFTRVQLHAILNVAQRRYPLLYEVIRFAVASGLRESRIFGLRWDHVDYARNEVRTPPKRPGAPEHILPLSGPIKKILNERLTVRRPNIPWVFYNPEPRIAGKFQWSSLRESWWNVLDEAGLRTRTDKRAVVRRVKENARRLAVGEPPLPEVEVDSSLSAVFHGLRHTFASMLVDQKVPTTMAQKLLGHTDLVTTQKYLDSLRSPQEYLDDLNTLGDMLDHFIDEPLLPMVYWDDYLKVFVEAVNADEQSYIWEP